MALIVGSLENWPKLTPFMAQKRSLCEEALTTSVLPLASTTFKLIKLSDMRPYWPWYLPSPPPKPDPRRLTQPLLPVARDDARIRNVIFFSLDIKLVELSDDVALMPERVNDYIGIHSTLKQSRLLVRLDSDSGEF